MSAKGINASAIYQIKNLANGRVYVGSAVNFANRKKEHLSKLRRGIHHSPKLQAAFNKYGEQSFSFEIVEYVADKSQLLFCEQGWMDLSGCVDFGYNICRTAGSNLGRKLSPETVARMKVSRQFVSEETRQKRSQSLKGRPKSEEWKRKMSEIMKGRKASNEAKKKMSESALARSDESKSNIANAIRAFDVRNGGRHTTESRAKISKSLKTYYQK